MAIIIETCPKCGHDLHDVVLASNPPIPKKECFNCGWSWQGEPEQVIRVPFGGNSFKIDNKYVLNGSMYDEIVDNCMANSLNRSVFMVDQNKLDDISRMNYDDLVEGLKNYINEKLEINL